MKTGVIDTGGGMRGIFATGVLDSCIERGIWFDLGIGISAGSANVSSYIAKQKGRNYQFYVEYSARKEYMSVQNFLRKKSNIDMDYVYGTLSNSDGENPLDYDTFIKSPKEFLAVATDAETGEPAYFGKEAMPLNEYNVLKASCAILFVCKPYEVNGRAYYDGALSDPIPIEKAFSMGCEKVVLILTKPENVLRTSEKDEKLARGIQKKYPYSAAKLRQRAEKYNRGIDLAKRYADQGKVLIVAPDNTQGVDTLKRSPEDMKALYLKGKKSAWEIEAFLKQDGMST